MTAAEAFTELVQIMERLRAPGGCPWDREQTNASIKPYTIEEAYEVAEAIDHGDDRELCTELGDLLLQIVFHAQMAAESGRFTVVDVCRAINDKLVRRHPHVFADTKVEGTAEVLRNWSRIKAEERKHSDDRSALAGVPRSMPALLRAQRLGEKAAHVGFDWQNVDGVRDKVREELDELEAAIAAKDQAAAEAELGDLLYAAAQLARHLNVSAEDVLTKTSDRFTARFHHMEAQLGTQNRHVRDAAADELDALWEAAKRSFTTEARKHGGKA
jgi:MazG family protein